MAKFRHSLPQLAGGLFLTDGGLETTLLFLEGLELPEFAAFPLLATDAGRAAIVGYFETYASLARKHGTGLILESATWRANPDWAAKLGIDADSLWAFNKKAIEVLERVRAASGLPSERVVISGCVGPRGDGYIPANAMTIEEAAAYHGGQISVFCDSAADLVTAITMNYVEEATGVAEAAKRAAMPVVISFTVETDGRLPTGQPLGSAIEEVDVRTGSYPAYYMINCAHPSHFRGVLDARQVWTKRIRGLRANASRKSHAELNDATDLDIGDPTELGREHAELKQAFPHINVLGGCCGTDDRHIDRIAAACVP